MSPQRAKHEKKEQRDAREAAEPPEPPEFDRRIKLDLPRLIGLALMAAIPVLAIAGLFGESWSTAEAVTARLHVRVEYPTRMRWRLARPLTVRVENRSAELLDTVHVEFDTSYVEQFTGVNFQPAPEESYTVSLTSLRPGENRHVYVELQSEVAGRHPGRIVVRTNRDSAVARVSTTVFP